MPTSLTSGAAQVIIVPKFSFPGDIIVPEQSPVALTYGKLLLPTLSGGGELDPKFVRQPTPNGPLIFGQKGYVNFYVVAPVETSYLNNQLRVGGVIFKNSLDGYGWETNQAYKDFPPNGISMIDNKQTDLFGPIEDLFKTTDSGLGGLAPYVQRVDWKNSVVRNSICIAGVQVYNDRGSEPAGANKWTWNPKWNVYILFQWGDGRIGLVDPDIENEVEA